MDFDPKFDKGVHLEKKSHFVLKNQILQHIYIRLFLSDNDAGDVFIVLQINELLYIL